MYEKLRNAFINNNSKYNDICGNFIFFVCRPVLTRFGMNLRDDKFILIVNKICWFQISEGNVYHLFFLIYFSFYNI